MMHSKKFTCLLAIVVSLTVAGTSMSGNSAYVFAANINCAGVSVGFCLGTNDSDNIIGDGNINRICGRAGNDNINGGAGTDLLLGNIGNDIINGGDGGDTVAGGNVAVSECVVSGPFGSAGADRLVGGPGNDVMYHNGIPGTGPPASLTSSDGARDYIDCGPGTDVALINTSTDGDVAINCEKVDTG